MDEDIYVSLGAGTAAEAGLLEAQLYDDLFVAPGNHESYLQAKASELEDLLRQRDSELRTLKGQLEARDQQLEKMTQERATLLRNISCLYITAKEEMARKQSEISGLRIQLAQMQQRPAEGLPGGPTKALQQWPAKRWLAPTFGAEATRSAGGVVAAQEASRRQPHERDHVAVGPSGSAGGRSCSREGSIDLDPRPHAVGPDPQRVRFGCDAHAPEEGKRLHSEPGRLLTSADTCTSGGALARSREDGVNPALQVSSFDVSCGAGDHASAQEAPRRQPHAAGNLSAVPSNTNGAAKRCRESSMDPDSVGAGPLCSSRDVWNDAEAGSKRPRHERSHPVPAQGTLIGQREAHDGRGPASVLRKDGQGIGLAEPDCVRSRGRDADNGQGRGADRCTARDAHRGTGREADRSRGQDYGRATGRDGEHVTLRARERGARREADHGIERGADRSSCREAERSHGRHDNRWAGRDGEHGTRQNAERGTERDTDRGMGRVADRSTRREVDRIGDYGRSRKTGADAGRDSGHERDLDDGRGRSHRIDGVR